MRRIDNWAGIPVCFLLGAVEYIRGIIFGTPEIIPEDKTRRILVIKFLGLGSLVQATGMFRLLRKRHPDAKIALLTFKPGGGLAKLFGIFDEVREIRTACLFLFAWDSIKALCWGRFSRFDASYDLEFYSKYSYIVSYLIGAPMRFGYFVRPLRHVKLLTHPVPFNPNRHISQAFLSQLSGGNDDPRAQTLEPPVLSAGACKEAENILTRFGIQNAGCLIAVNINASKLSALRFWPQEYFTEMITRLHKRYDAVFLFVGAVEDRPRIDEFLNRLPGHIRAVNIAGFTNMENLLSLMSRVKLLVSNDSGPLHIAAMIGAPTISFFGAESGRVYGPVGEKHINLDKELYCSPCLNAFNFKEFDCPYGLRCLKEITPDEAFSAAEKLLGAPQTTCPILPHGDIQTGADKSDVSTIRKTNCPICGEKTKETTLPQNDLPLSFCRNCFFAWQNPVPSDKWLKAVYQLDHYSASGGPNSAAELVKRATFARWLAEIEKALPQRGRLLDLGCAGGLMLGEAKASGWEVFGIDISERAVETARRNFGPAVKLGELEEMDFPEGYFDAVTMFDYIEHVRDLNAVFLKLRRILKPGGILALTTPDVDSLSSLLLGGLWPHYKREHIYYFSKQAVSAFAQAQGFRVVKAIPARKTVSLNYLSGQFKIYPQPLFTPLFSALDKIAPSSLKNFPFKVSLGEIFVILSKK